MDKFFPHILGAIFVLIIIGAWMLIAHLVKKPNDTQVPMLLIFVNRQYERDSVAHDIATKNEINLLDAPIGAVVKY